MDLFEQPAGSLFPDFNQIAQTLNNLPDDPTVPKRPRPTSKVLLERKERIVRFWRPRNLRMLDDERLYKSTEPVEERIGADEFGASESIMLGHPFTLVEKVSNMIAAQRPIQEVIPKDPGLKQIAQKVQDYTYWWRETAAGLWSNNLNGDLFRDEVHFLALRGWVAGRIMLDPADEDFPYRYDLIDPIHVYPEPGAKEIRWVFHVYKDSKVNVINNMGFDQELVDRIEEQLGGLDDLSDVEVASFYDDVWHVLFIDDQEVWSAPHNYGFVPWVITYSFGPPIRRTDPVFGVDVNANTMTYASRMNNNWTAWWGISAFAGIKQIYQKLNKLASAVLTEAMKAADPPVVIMTNPQGEQEGKTIDMSIGATSYLQKDTEDFEIPNYGFQAKDLAPVLQLLQDSMNRGSLPAVMYGEGADYMSGFAVNLLQGGARDVMLPLVRAHENYMQNLFRKILRMTAEHYPLPVNMVETNPETGERKQMTTITGDDISLVGYHVKVHYKTVLPQDETQQSMIAANLVDKKIISLDTARRKYLGLENPSLENEKVLTDLVYFDQDVVQAAIPAALAKIDPVLLGLWVQAQFKKQQDLQMQMAMEAGGAPAPSSPPPSGGQSPPVSQLPNNVAGGIQQQTGAAPNMPPSGALM